MSNNNQEKEPVNFVHQDRILGETIAKEKACGQPYTNFTINPFSKMVAITGKPNSLEDAYMEGGEKDPLMVTVINASRRPPTEKYCHPVTSSHEYGWISQPLLKLDRSDVRLHHPRKQTDVTIPKEAEWKLKEQTQNLN